MIRVKDIYPLWKSSAYT